MEEIDMLNEKTMYRFRLEDYAAPICDPQPFSYFATMDEIAQWATDIANDETLNKRYGYLLAGLDEYDLDPDVTHWVSGQEVRILEPMKELARSEATASKCVWGYDPTSSERILYCVGADSTDVEQVLLQDSVGLYRCIKASFENLQVRVERVGWMKVEDVDFGAPKMIEHTGNICAMRMYICAQTYALGSYDKAVKDMHHPNRKELSLACHDVIGMGLY